jgi:hypothetical protein
MGMLQERHGLADRRTVALDAPPAERTEAIA